MNFDFRRHLVHADRGIFVEITLDGPASVDRDFVGHDGAQTLDDAAAHLIFGVERIDDLAANVAGGLDFVDLDFLPSIHTQLDDFRKITTMRKLEGNAHSGVFWQIALAPAGFFGDEFEDILHARSVEIDITGIGGRRCAGYAGSAKNSEAELDGIFSGRVSEFIRERLEDPGEGVATGSAQSVGGNAERHEGGAKEKVLEKGARKLIAGDARGGSELFAFAETDEVIAPGDEFDGMVETALEEMETGGAIVVMMKIVFASPEEFYKNANLFGDGAGFEHVVVGEAAAESAAGALQVNDDVVVGNIENSRDEQAAIFRSLTGRPELEFAVVIMGETIFGLHGSVREEGIGVSGLNCFRGGLERFRGITVTAKGNGGRLLGKLLGAASKACAALLGGGTFLPL